MNAQVLLNHSTPVNFNVGGVVNCVAFDSTKNVYALGGDFDTINGVIRHNLCFLDSSNLSLSLVAPYTNAITSIDGPINALKFVGNKLFVGGSFTQINGQPRSGLAVFNYAIIFGIPKYVLNSWAPLNTCASGAEAVNCFEYKNDTLFIGGAFLYFDTDCKERYGFAAINPNTLTTYSYGAMAGFSGSWPEIKKIEYYQHSVFIGGYEFLVTDFAGNTASSYRTALCKLKPNGNIDMTFNPTWTTGGAPWFVFDLDVTQYGVYILKYGTGALAKNFSRQNFSTGAAMNINVNDPSNIPVFDSPTCLEYYKKKLFSGSYNTSGSPPSPHFGGRNILDQYPFWDGNLSIPFDVGSITRIQNRLFVSENNLDSSTAISGQIRNGLAVYCLEPYNASGFIIYDSTICPGQSGVTFKVPAVPYAEKYHWYYTGTGANIAGSGSSVVLSGIIYNQVTVDFSSSFTAGKLCLVPMSTCDERADTLVINILVNPVPNANAGVDKFLTCKYPEITVVGTSSSSPVSFSWTGPFSFLSTNDSILVDTSGTYTFTVTSLLNGCTKSDNMIVGYDTARPNVTLPSPPYELTCSDTVITLTGTSSDLQTSLEWRNVSTGSLFSNPIDVNTPGQYMFIVTDTLNGCPDSLPLIVTLYQVLPNIKVSGYAAISTSIPLDTINCYTPFFDFIGYSDSASTTVYFTDSTQTLNFGDSVHVDSSGFYYLVAKSSITGCENFVGFYVSENLNVPDLVLPSSPEINCSIDSAILDASTIMIGTQIFWDGPSIVDAPNPLTVFLPGYYSATNFNPENGCSITDSVLMSYIPEIIINGGNDTVVCKGTSLNLMATYVGVFSGISYLWSNGDVDSLNSIVVNSNQINVITISEPGGCVGVDTIVTNVPNMPIDSIVGFKPCGADSSGQLVIYLTNGLAPYSYSLDGVSFQSLSQFNNLTVGNYTVYVKDSLGCNYTYTAMIDANSALPQPFFLNSTYNSIDDTIVLIDVSSPVPDSIQWILPSSFQLIEFGSTALIKSNDTGVFQITMLAYFGECSIDTSKYIYIREFDTTLANLINQNGIRKLILYANPNNGLFSVELEFYKKQDYTIGVYDINSTNWFSNFETESFGNIYSIDISSAINGAYILRVVSEFDSKSINFIIQH